MTTTTRILDPGDLGPVAVTTTDLGHGRPVLLLHGGGGPQTVLPWASHLAGAGWARVVTPVHPGFGGTPRPDRLDSVRGLAATYDVLLATLDLHDVLVVGNSVGGWIAAEMAARASDRVSAYVLVDAVGLEVPGHPVADVSGLSPAEIAQLSFADPATYAVDPADLPPEVIAAQPGNRAALAVYAGPTMTDPGLRSRLANVSTPVLVVWGAADRIVDGEYGRSFASAVPGARLEVLPAAGHLPQVEAPAALASLVRSFAATTAAHRPPV